MNEQDLVTRLRKRAEIRRQIATRKSVQEGKPDRIADLLEEAADEIGLLRGLVASYGKIISDASKSTQKSTEVWSDSLTKEQAIAFVEKLTGGWKDLEPELWEEVIISIEDRKDILPIEEGHGTHCENYVYRVGKNLYDLTYEYGHEKPIDIKFKRVSEYEYGNGSL